MAVFPGGSPNTQPSLSGGNSSPELPGAEARWPQSPPQVGEGDACRAGHFEDVMKCLYWPWALSAMALKYRVNLSS